MDMSNLERINYYIKKLETENGDPQQIADLKRVRQIYLDFDSDEKKFKERIKYRPKTKETKKTEKTKKIIKRPSMKKQIGIGLLVGTLVGIPTGMLSYNIVTNIPSAHNYTTNKEKRLNLKHDDSNYRKYLKGLGLSEEEIEERIFQEEESNRWNRDNDTLVDR